MASSECPPSAKKLLSAFDLRLPEGPPPRSRAIICSMSRRGGRLDAPLAAWPVAAIAGPGMAVVCAASSSSRSRCTLPDGPLGRSGTKWMRVGVLKWPRRLSQKASISLSSPAIPARNTTKATRSSPT